MPRRRDDYRGAVHLAIDVTVNLDDPVGGNAPDNL
jgi:hypothetical protein